MERREFSRYLRESGYTPNQYAELTGFDRRNVKRWLFDDNNIPGLIREIILQTLEPVEGSDACSKRSDRLHDLRAKVGVFRSYVLRRDGSSYYPKFARELMLNPPTKDLKMIIDKMFLTDEFQDVRRGLRD